MMLLHATARVSDHAWLCANSFPYEVASEALWVQDHVLAECTSHAGLLIAVLCFVRTQQPHYSYARVFRAHLLLAGLCSWTVL